MKDEDSDKTYDINDDGDLELDGPTELSTSGLSPRARKRVTMNEKARRRIIVGHGLFVHGTGYDPDSPLGTVVATHRNWFHSPDPALIFAALGTVAGHLLPGPPVWLMLVGQQSSGKTEIIMATTGLSKELAPMAVVSSMKESALLSGTPQKDKGRHATGGILPPLSPHGILLMKDFTSVLQMDREERGKCLGALREIYDGKWVRSVGSDGGRDLIWEGKCSVLGGCTFAIDTFHSVMSLMGERFMYFRLPLVNGYAQSRVAIDNNPFHDIIQESMQSVVAELFQSIVIPKSLPQFTVDELHRMTALASIVATCRTPVERDSGNREITAVKPPEAPARVSKSLTQLFHGMMTIGVHREEAWRVISKVALDCASAHRLMVIQALSMEGMNNSTSVELSEHLQYPRRPIERTLEDLEAISPKFVERVKEGSAIRWKLSGFAASEYKRAFPKRPEVD